MDLVFLYFCILSNWRALLTCLFHMGSIFNRFRINHFLYLLLLWCHQATIKSHLDYCSTLPLVHWSPCFHALPSNTIPPLPLCSSPSSLLKTIYKTFYISLREITSLYNVLQNLAWYSFLILSLTSLPLLSLLTRHTGLFTILLWNSKEY